MLCKSKDIKMPDVRYIIHRNKYTISKQLRSKIQSTQNRFKLIKFNDGKKKQISE